MFGWIIRRWWVTSIPAAVLAFWVIRYYTGNAAAASALEASAGEEGEEHAAPRDGGSSDVRVDVVKPRSAGLERSTTQPASVHAFDFAELHAKVSGYLKRQLVDIGDYVKQGQLLAEIDAPEYQSELDRAKAALNSAEAKMAQAKVEIDVAVAARKAAEASLDQSRANVKRDTAALKYRELQYRRISELWKLHSIDEQLVDEKEDQRLAAQAALDASNAAVTTAEANLAQADANIEKAKADLRNAEAEVLVAKAAVERAQIYVNYLKITSPYDGVVTQREFHVGDFIREATQGTTPALFTVTRTDKMRVIVQIPDQDVPFTDPGDRATVQVDALAGVNFEGKVARIANSEDPTSRTMRVEIDVPNPENRLRDGMYGYATIVLQPATTGMSVPSSCLVGDAKEGKAQVYVVRDGVAHLTPVTVGQDNGIDIEILSGLAADSEVVRQYSGPISDGARVSVSKPTDEVALSAATKDEAN